MAAIKIDKKIAKYRVQKLPTAEEKAAARWPRPRPSSGSSPRSR